MSLGYAEKLSYREDLGGQLGSPELFDSGDDVSRKTSELVQMIKASKKVVVFTGAGISTSCGIPDFRGPNGIWTLQRAKKPLPEFKTSFTFAKPSLTHMALVSLHRMGKLSFICSQNVDGLHLRSGIPRSSIAELHGNCFSERCPSCGKEYIRNFEIETVGFKRTGRVCTVEGCNGRLKDHILDWEDALPEDELEASEQHASDADLAICLGTSLQITPACNIPLRTPKAGGKLVIVNLQKTPKDRHAALLIRARCDEVMRGVLQGLGVPPPRYVRHDQVLLVFRQSAPRQRKPGASAAPSLPFAVQACTSHGWKCPVPAVASVKVTFPDNPELKESVLRKPPFVVRRSLPADSAGRQIRVRFELRMASSVAAEAGEIKEEEACFTALGADDLLLDESAPKSEALPTKLWPEAERYNVQVKTVDIITQTVDYDTPLEARTGEGQKVGEKRKAAEEGCANGNWPTGKGAIGRRVRAYWTAEKRWFEVWPLDAVLRPPPPAPVWSPARYFVMRQPGPNLFGMLVHWIADALAVSAQLMHKGTLENYFESTGMHMLKYDDGDHEHVKLPDSSIAFL